LAFGKEAACQDRMVVVGIGCEQVVPAIKSRSLLVPDSGRSASGQAQD
jgi:hypothetical protein